MLLPRDKNSSVVNNIHLHTLQYYQKKHDTTLRHALQADLILHDFFLTSFDLTQLENLHHSSNLCHNIWFNAFWHRPYVSYVAG
jgi:hypothetical protein